MREVPGSIPRSSTFAPSWSQLRYLKHQKSVTTVVNWRPRNDRFFKNSTTLKERHHSKEMVLLNCKTVQPIHDNIRYTDLKAPMGFEPMTSCLLDRCSNHLSYGAKRRLSARKCSRDTGAATTSWKYVMQKVDESSISLCEQLKRQHRRQGWAHEEKNPLENRRPGT